jgi:basic membrane protein A
MRRAIADGYSPIICVGFAYASVVADLAPSHPGTRFVIIDATINDGLANVQSIVFREEQGSFLVGVLAAMTTETSIVGFVGGRDCDVIRNFACGFAQGVQHQSPATKVRVRMAGTTGAAFKAPAIGARLTRELAGQGADIVFHAAGGTGMGVISAAEELGILAIGVDLNQNALAPGTVLTSMLKRIDVAVYLALSDAASGQWQPGVRWLGLEEDGVGWALDEHNLDLVPLPVQKRMEEVHFDVVMGEIEVHRYADDRHCPAHSFAALPAE